MTVFKYFKENNFFIIMSINKWCEPIMRIFFKKRGISEFAIEKEGNLDIGKSEIS